MGPPSSGATTVGQILGLLDRFKPSDFALAEPHLWHLFAEASRLAYADRAQYLGDSDFVKVPVKGLLDPGYLDQRARLIHGFQAAEGQSRGWRAALARGHANVARCRPRHASAPPISR